jgi:hypothetical protein
MKNNGVGEPEVNIKCFGKKMDTSALSLEKQAKRESVSRLLIL